MQIVISVRLLEDMPVDRRLSWQRHVFGVVELISRQLSLVLRGWMATRVKQWHDLSIIERIVALYHQTVGLATRL